MTVSTAAYRKSHLTVVPAQPEIPHEMTRAPGRSAASVRPATGEFDPIDADRTHAGATDGRELEAEGSWAERSAPAQEAVRLELQNRIAAYLGRGRPRVILTDNLHTMLSIKRGGDVWTIRLHHMFAQAPPIVLRAVARYAERHCPEASRVLRAFIDANDERVRKRDRARPIQIDVEGRHHNLQAIYDDLNARYFGGRIEARITWGQRTRRRRGRESIKLGSYTVEDQLIRIHPVLDAVDVPRFFVAYIVFHEMLHEVHDMPLVDGRRVYHTKAFRRDEKRFEAYDASIQWEKANLHKLLDR